MATTTYNQGKDSICIYSYNSRGFSEDKQDVCKILFVDTEKYYPILCNQENFLLKGNNYQIKQCLHNARVIFKEAIKDSFEGRPKNGMFVAIPLEIKEHVIDVSLTHWRVQTIILSTPSNKVLIINSYFPTDSRGNEFETTDLFSTLSAINSALMENEYDSVIWGGDMNADFLRYTVFTSNISRFVEEKSFEKSWDKYPVDFTHVFEREEHTYTSTLDHFFWNEGISCHVVAAEVLHLPNNTSDHCPLYCIVDIKTMPPKKRVLTMQQQPIPCWKRVTGEQKANFKTMLDNKLQLIDIPWNLDFCHDVHCKDECHISECGKCLVDGLDSIKLSAASCLPSPSNRKSPTKKTTIFRWNEDVQPFTNKAMFWHSIWLTAG